MKAKAEKKWIIKIISALIIISAGLLWHKSTQKPGMEINCSAILHYDHVDPDYVSALEMTFRLDSDYEGLVVLSGSIATATGKQTVSRNITFDYNVKVPGEIIIRNMKYIKTFRDTAQDDILTRGFFYVPDGTERQLRLNPLGNAWLLGNQQSPFALCINKKS